MLPKRVRNNKRFVKKKRHFVPKVKPFIGLTEGMAVLFPRSASEYNELINGPQAFLDSCEEKLLSTFGPNGSFIKQLTYRVFTPPIQPNVPYSRNNQNEIV